MVTVFKEKLNLQLCLTFYSSIRFVFETAFISEQIAENRFVALFVISDKFITKFNVFSCMSFAWKVIVCSTKVRDELLEMGKNLEMKHSVSYPPTKYGETFFIKKLYMEKQTFLGKFFGVCFTWGLMIRLCKGGS